MPNTLRALHLAPWVGQSSFGVGPVVLSIAQSQLEYNCNADIWCTDLPNEIDQILPGYESLRSRIRCFPVIGPARLAFSPRMEEAQEECVSKYDIVHAHGIWTAVSRVSNRWRVISGKPTVVAPHGSLDPWALQLSKWKKHFSRVLYEDSNLHKASCLHVLSLQEAEGCRAYGLKSPIAVLPNGISSQWLQAKGDAQAFRQKNKIEKATRLIFFLGRITPKKGLSLMIKAIYELKSYFEGWKFIVAGVDEFGHRRELEDLVAHLALEQFVQFVGPQYAQDKLNAYAASDFFVLPSYSEGAPLVILEALGAGVPVVATKASPWPELKSHSCGWWVDISVEGVGNALQDAIKTSQAELKAMGQRGKQLVREKYTWSQIAKQTLMLYEWLCGGGIPPFFVNMD